MREETKRKVCRMWNNFAIICDTLTIQFTQFTVIIADSPQALQKLKNKISAEKDQLSLRNNIDKTKGKSRTSNIRTNFPCAQ